MKKVLCLVSSLFLATSSACAFGEEPSMIKMTVNGMQYEAELENNETAAAFSALLPMELAMTELNGNEKYHDLSSPLPAASDYSGQINAGDLMLWGSTCVVLFYDSFATGYSYTRLGHICNPEGLQDALGQHDAVVSFSMPGNWISIPQDDAYQLMQTDDSIIILDVREQYEYDNGHIPNALLLPYDAITAESAAQLLPDKHQTILVYCRSGRRSKIGAQTLADLGYTDIREFGGIIDWPYACE